MPVPFYGDDGNPISIIPWVVFIRKQPQRRIMIECRNWSEARKLGARKLKRNYKEVWAATPLEGETEAEAVERVK